jgi:hypothetical protein
MVLRQWLARMWPLLALFFGLSLFLLYWFWGPILGETVRLFCLVVIINLIVVYCAYRYRDALYRWIEKNNHQRAATIDGERN